MGALKQRDAPVPVGDASAGWHDRRESTCGDGNRACGLAACCSVGRCASFDQALLRISRCRADYMRALPCSPATL